MPTQPQLFVSNDKKLIYAFDPSLILRLRPSANNSEDLVVEFADKSSNLMILSSKAPELREQIVKAFNPYSHYQIEIEENQQPKPDFVWKLRESYSSKNELYLRCPNQAELKKVLVKLKELVDDESCQVTNKTWYTTDCTIKVFFSEWFYLLDENIKFLESVSVLGPQSN